MSEQLVTGDRDGATFEPKIDRKRLNAQAIDIFNLMKDGRWRTLSDIHNALPKHPEASISARLRDFRKPKFGGFTVERERYDGGRKPGAGVSPINMYRLIVPPKQMDLFAH